METSLCPSWYIGTHLQATFDEGYSNMPSSLLVEEQGMDSPYFLPSSPSLDMEAALQHLSSSSCGDSELSSSSPNSPEDVDVLMADPFLDFLNDVLMEEGVEDWPSPITQQDAEAYFQATLSSLYDIIGDGQHSSPASTLTSETASASHLSHEHASSDATSHEDFYGFDHSHPCDTGSQYEHQVDIIKPYLGSMEQNETERNSLGIRHNPPISLEQGNAESSSFPAKGDFLFSLEQGEVKSNNSPARSSSHIILAQAKPEILAQKHESVKISLSQVDAAAHLPHLETSHASEHAILRGLNDARSSNERQAQDVEQCTGKSGLLLSSGKSTSKSASIAVPFEDMKDEAGYAALYVGKPTATTTDRGSSLKGDKKSSNGKRKGSKAGGNGNTEVLGFVDVREVLVNCAQAVAIGDGKKATEILQELYLVHGVCSNGNGLQRTAHYFCEALVARMGGMGGHHYRAMCANMPSEAFLLRSTRLWFELSPYMRIMHYFANQNILKAAEGASRLHVVDYGIMYGMQWPCLINALADREGGPPLLVITGIEFPKPGQNSLERLEESGRRLAAYAKTYNVPFRFHALVTEKWEDVGPASLHLHLNEVLVVNCMKRFRYLADESVDSVLTISPREKLLMTMHSLKPHLLLIADVNAACSSPFFVSRFREALYFYTNMFDIIDTLLGDQPERDFLERNHFFREILNIVACEGAERVERLETYKQLDARVKRAGFGLLPIPSVILSRSKLYVMQHYHKDCMVHDDGKGWMLLGWKGRAMLAISAWVCV